MHLTSNDTYNGHPLQKTPDTATSTGWWYVPDLSLHVKIHERWRAEIWLEPDVLHLARLRIFDHRLGAEWLDTSYPRGTTGVTPFRRADQFMLHGQMPGWGEWPSEPTSNGPVPITSRPGVRGGPDLQLSAAGRVGAPRPSLLPRPARDRTRRTGG
jgi:hypothetical protein